MHVAILSSIGMCLLGRMTVICMWRCWLRGMRLLSPVVPRRRFHMTAPTWRGAGAERYERAAELERDVSEVDGKLGAYEAQWWELLERYEALDAREEDCQRKMILARREAAKFLSSVEQDARAKAQQYLRDAHARLEEQRASSARRQQALVSEEDSLSVAVCLRARMLEFVWASVCGRVWACACAGVCVDG